MQFKDYFTVPSGEKITEKHLRRVLISSICGILLCMSCLAGTTWAWFTVSIENTNNVIQIGEPKVSFAINGAVYDSGVSLAEGTTYNVKIEHANDLDDFQKKSTLYVTLTLVCDDETVIKYAKIDQDEAYTKTITINTGKKCTLYWEVSWFAPANATELVDDAIVIEAPVVPETTAPPTEKPVDESSVPSGTPSGETETPSDTPSEETVTPPETTTGQTEEPSETTSEPTGDAEGSDESQPSVPSTEIPDDSATADSAESDPQPSTDDPTDEET